MKSLIIGKQTLFYKGFQNTFVWHSKSGHLYLPIKNRGLFQHELIFLHPLYSTNIHYSRGFLWLFTELEEANKSLFITR